jgi:phage head maturation protease
LNTLITRSFETHFYLRADDADGNTVEGRIVPYNEPTDVTEVVNGEVKRYREQFLPGSFYEMARGAAARGNASWVGLCLDHEDSFDAKIGHAISLVEESDGAYGTFRLYPSRDIDKVRGMLTESHRGLSVEFVDMAKPKVIDGIVSRVQIHLKRVAATPTPAYANAGILAMREGENDLTRPNLESVRALLADLKR